jgi:hypothetical protein
MNLTMPAFALLCALCLPLQAAAQLNVIYPSMEERSSDSYGYKVLSLALEKSGRPFHLALSASKMNHDRALKSIEEGVVSIIDVGTSADLEERFATIYFPIDQGISGYRLFIINKNRAGDFAAIKTLADLQKKVAGQGPGWSDIKILEQSGIRVVTAEFTSLFKMVDIGRFDFYPLGIEEVFGLLEKFKANCPNSIVEPTLVLHYPFARLFFVRKDNKVLQDAIMDGLDKAFTDGSFQKLINNDPAFKEARQRSEMGGRTVIEVGNPNLTEKFKKIPAKYFTKPYGFWTLP